jgi:hypothetical protein
MSCQDSKRARQQQPFIYYASNSCAIAPGDFSAGSARFALSRMRRERPPQQPDDGKRRRA